MVMVLTGQLCHTPLTKQPPASDSTTALALHYYCLSLFLLGTHAKEIAQLGKKKKRLMTQMWIRAVLFTSQNLGNLQRAGNTEMIWESNKQFHTVPYYATQKTMERLQNHKTI